MASFKSVYGSNLNHPKKGGAMEAPKARPVSIRILAAVMAFLLAVTMVPATAFAGPVNGKAGSISPIESPASFVSFSYNGGLGRLSNGAVVKTSTHPIGTTVTVEKNMFKRERHVFKGWNTREDGKGTSYKVGDRITLPANNVTLFAMWYGDLSSARIAKLSYERTTYTGYAKKPVPTVTFLTDYLYNNGSIIQWRTKTVKLVRNRDYKITYSNNVATGVGYVRVTGIGRFRGTTIHPAAFTIAPARKARPTKITVGSKRMRVYWKKAVAKQKVTGYQIRWRAVGSSKWKTRTVAGGANKTSIILTGLVKGKRYYVQIRNYKKAADPYQDNRYTLYGAWSTTRTSAKIR